MTTENKWFDMSRKLSAKGEPSNEAEISIYDQIGGWGITANDFIGQLKALGDVDTINLRIASGGGSIVEGNTIYNALKRHSAKVVTHIDSLAASMASVIAMAGDEIHMAENALLMIHNPWTMSMGGADQLRKDADLLDKMEENIRTSYGRSNLSAEDLDSAMESETYYTAAEAKELGFIDEIEGQNLAAASIGDMETIKGFDALPQGKIDAIKIECQSKQIETLQAKVTNLAEQIKTIDENLLIANNGLAKVEEEKAQMVTDHKAEIERTKVIKDDEISARAAEQLQADGTPPIGNDPASDHVDPIALKMSEEQFWAEYRAFDKRGDFEGKNTFYSENKHVIGQ